MTAAADPYCGPAPLPAEIWSQWNLDPLLIVVAAAILLLCRSTSGRNFRAGLSPVAAMAWLVMAVAFISPLCALSSALFSARIVHHVLLVAMAAPLFAVAFPAGRMVARLPIGALLLLHAGAMWLWHAPAPYAFALSGLAPYWLMEASLFASALLLWQRVLSPSTHPGGALALLLFTTIQMGMLGALLTFAGEPLFEHHFTTTLAFGLTPLEDQQLAGLIMWVPAAIPYVIAAIVLVMRFFDTMEGSAHGGRRR
jgi:putative membrane protein